MKKNHRRPETGTAGWPFSRIVISLPMATFFLMLIISGLYAVFIYDEYRGRMSETASAAVDQYQETIERYMRQARNSAYLMYADNQDAVMLAHATTEKRRLDALHSLSRHAGQNMEWNEDMAGYAILYDDYQKHRYFLREGMSYPFQQALISDMHALLSGVKVYYGWESFVHDGKAYLYYVHAQQGVAVCAVIQLPEAAGGGAGPISLDYTFRGEPLTGQQDPEAEEGIRFAGNQIIVSRTVLNMQGFPLTLHARFQIRNLLTLRTSMLIVFAGMAVLLLVVLLSLLLVRRMLTRPLGRMMRTMEKIRKGDTEATMDCRSSVREYHRIQESFNAMLAEVRMLRIQKYEKELENQGIQLQYLKLQLEPHFMLNCLTSLYALSRQRKTEKLEQRILTLSDYFRYELQSDFALRPLKEEMAFARDAMEIRQDTLEHGVAMEEEIDPEVAEWPVPPMVVETFVENSMKYAANGKKLEIHVSAWPEEDEHGRWLHLTVFDNGRGYPEHWLEAIDDGKEENSRHIGLINLKKRLELLYGGRASFQIYNDRGAAAEILLPADGREAEHAWEAEA